MKRVLSKNIKKEVGNFYKEAGIYFLFKRNENLCRKCQHSYWVKKQNTKKEDHDSIFKYCELDRMQCRGNRKYCEIFTDLSGRWKNMTVRDFFSLYFLPTDCPFIMEHQVLGKQNEITERH